MAGLGYAPGEGCKLFLKMGETPAFVEVANITSLTPPTMAVGEVEWTNVASTKKRYRPSKIPESGVVSGELNYDRKNETTHAEFFSLMTTPELRDWKIVYNDDDEAPSEDLFSGFLTSLNPTGIADASNVTASFSIRIDGEIT